MPRRSVCKWFDICWTWFHLTDVINQVPVRGPFSESSLYSFIMESAKKGLKCRHNS